jgi:hypothetical protein
MEQNTAELCAVLIRAMNISAEACCSKKLRRVGTDCAAKIIHILPYDEETRSSFISLLRHNAFPWQHQSLPRHCFCGKKVSLLHFLQAIWLPEANWSLKWTERKGLRLTATLKHLPDDEQKSILQIDVFFCFQEGKKLSLDDV